MSRPIYVIGAPISSRDTMNRRRIRWRMKNLTGRAKALLQKEARIVSVYGAGWVLASWLWQFTRRNHSVVRACVLFALSLSRLSAWQDRQTVTSPCSTISSSRKKVGAKEKAEALLLQSLTGGARALRCRQARGSVRLTGFLGAPCAYRIRPPTEAPKHATRTLIGRIHSRTA